MTEATRSANLNSNVTDVTRLLMAKHGGINQTQLADAIGVDKALITRCFKGRREWKVAEIEAMARYFDVGWATFMTDPDELFRSRCDWTAPLVAVTNREFSLASA